MLMPVVQLLLTLLLDQPLAPTEVIHFPALKMLQVPVVMITLPEMEVLTY